MSWIDRMGDIVNDPMCFDDLDLDGEGQGDGRAYHSPWELDRQSSGDIAEREYWRDMGP